MTTTIFNAITTSLIRTSWLPEVNKHGGRKQRPNRRHAPSMEDAPESSSVTLPQPCTKQDLLDCFATPVFANYVLAAVNPVMETFMIDVMKIALREQSAKIKELEDELTKKERQDRFTTLRNTRLPEDETEATKNFRTIKWHTLGAAPTGRLCAKHSTNASPRKINRYEYTNNTYVQVLKYLETQTDLHQRD